jgi:2-phospho-L-lactate guanylyltransferase (CobY/MobA/RfbA family)
MEEMSREVQMLVSKIDNLIAVFEQVSTVEEEEQEEEQVSTKELLEVTKSLNDEVSKALQQMNAKLDEVVSLLDTLPARMPKFGAALAEEGPEDILGASDLVAEEEA